jgi:cysteine desulfurase
MTRMAKSKPIARTSSNERRMASRGSPLERVYLDHNASAPLRPRARTAMLEALGQCGNPSSIHAEGRLARALVERARAEVAAAVGRRPRDVVFVSGGTEGVNYAVSGVFGPAPGRRCDVLLASAGEHVCVLAGHGFSPSAFETVPLRSDGRLDLDALSAALERRSGATIALALQAANNETGVLQPVAAAGAMARARGGMVLCDAVQALGRTRCDPAALDAEVLILSGHKIGGPKGVGALVFDGDRLHMGRALVRGGGQERGWRGGTENAPAIAGFGAACAEAAAEQENERKRLSRLRDRLEEGIRSIAPEATFFGRESERLANTSAFAAPGVSAETLVIALDLSGVSVSSGSACSSGKVGRSHVLAAMGVAPELARSALRVSLGWSSAESDVAVFCEAFEKALRSIGSRRVGRAA